jgi:3',5'-cyclic AMP phosphodiesterase CpdA
VRTIVHVSDLHFGAIDRSLVPLLRDAIRSIEPDLVATSGDLTQHAWPQEFMEAMEFLRSLPGHLMVVPGNHDLSFYNPWRRATQRLRLYRKHVTHELEPFYSDEELVICGFSTARVSHLRNGRIRESQIATMEERISTAPPRAIRVLMTHHPFDLPEGFAATELIGRGRRFMERVTSRIDLLLAGHMHISHAGPTAVRYRIAGQSAIFVQAGTALSTRVRGEENAFQVIRTSYDAIETEQWRLEAEGYVPQGRLHFHRSPDGGWLPAELAD